jgi:hypothetical protein
MTLLHVGSGFFWIVYFREQRFLREGSVERSLAGLIKIIIGLIFSVILITVIYILWGYYKIDCEFSKKEKYIVRPQVDAESVSEMGVVRELRTVTCIKNKTPIALAPRM